MRREAEQETTVMVMKRLTNGCVLIMLTWLAAAVIGCAASQPSPGLKIVPVASLPTIAGEWQGLSKRLPDMRDDAWVIFIIREDGHFTFVSNQRTAAMLGVGTLTILDRTMLARGAQGSATVTLHDKGGEEILVVQVTLNDGYHYYIEMTRVR